MLPVAELKMFVANLNLSDVSIEELSKDVQWAKPYVLHYPSQWGVFNLNDIQRGQIRRTDVDVRRFVAGDWIATRELTTEEQDWVLLDGGRKLFDAKRQALAERLRTLKFLAVCAGLEIYMTHEALLVYLSPRRLCGYVKGEWVHNYQGSVGALLERTAGIRYYLSPIRLENQVATSWWAEGHSWVDVIYNYFNGKNPIDPNLANLLALARCVSPDMFKFKYGKLEATNEDIT